MIAASPDPMPGTGNAPIRWVSYNYVTPAIGKVTHERIPGLWFHCHVPVHGRRVCVKFRR